MKIAVLKENKKAETRVAATPETVKKFIALGAEIRVEAGAGIASSIPDTLYVEAGATISSGMAETVKGADVVLKVQQVTTEELKAIAQGAVAIAIMSPHADPERIRSYADAGIDTLAMELMPRITRAQSMDVLSSQSNLAGYKAVIDAAEQYGRAMPMMMTAAGTIAPAKVLVMGAGVAGLQAIATAKRLGAIVSATDVRYAAKEQVESLGGTFVVVDEAAMKEAETEGGYAKEMSDDFKKRQAEFIAEHVKKQDIVITTALIPGRPAPALVNEEMVRSMKPGSVIIDLAVEQGGNVALSEAGKIVDVDGVKIIGHKNVPGRLATDASNLYARNIFNFLSGHINKDAKSLSIDWEDEILKAITLTRGGQIIHPDFGAPQTAEPLGGADSKAVEAEVIEAEVVEE